MNNVVVFGGDGFLGSYLVRELEARKVGEVTVADLTNNNNHPNFVKCDILDYAQVENLFKKKVDYVYNLAGFANLDRAILFPIKTLELNIIGNTNILEAAKKNQVKRFIYASSAYAMSNKGSFYGISKLASEKVVEEYGKRYALDYTILRYGSVYSEDDFDNNYIYGLVKKAVLENKIEHKGDGEEFREYIHALDAAKLSVDVLEQDAYINEHVMLTGMEKMKRSSLFDMINEILNNKLEITYQGDKYTSHYKITPYSFEPSRSKKLVANPHIDMGQGLLDCIKAVHQNSK